MRIICLSFLLFTVFACSNPAKKRTELIDYVPENTSVILRTSNLESLKSSIKNSRFLQQLDDTEGYLNLQKKLEHLPHFTPSSNIILCFSSDGNDSLQYTLITKFNQNLFKTDSLKNYIEETLTIKNRQITKSTINQNTFYSAVIDSVFFASSAQQFTTSAFNERPHNGTLKKVFGTTDNDKTASVTLTANAKSPLNSIFIEDSLSFEIFTEYFAADVELEQNEMYFNGITKATDSTKSLVNVFKSTIPQENQLQHITPGNADGFSSITFNDFKTFEKNLNQFKSKDSVTSSSLFKNISEIGVIYEGQNRAVALYSNDVIATQDALLAEQSKLDTYREVDIYSFSQPDLFANVFSPFISGTDANMYCILDYFFVFANNMETLQNIIASYQNETTLSQREYFNAITEKLSSAASFLQVGDASALKSILRKNLKDDSDFNLNSDNISAVQFIFDTNFAHVNGIISKNKARAAQHSVSEELNIKLDNDILNRPQLVKNHISGQKDIVVQDVKNNLYLISNTGKILWKKQLQGPVLGNIQQIDIYKNGRLQLIFATPNRVYVLDRNGKAVSPFPLKFNDKITQPLSVFDYDKRKNYRLLVTQGKNVLMYNVKGNIVKGFTFKSANGTIISQPKHFRIGSKDYIVLKTKDKLYILDRTGKTRVTPKNQADFSNQPLFLYNNKFTTTTENGKLFSVDTKGNTSSADLKLSENHFLQTTSKTLVTQSDNKLSIKNRTTELDFGNYSQPSIFYIYDKIYVSTTDQQAHKIYLFDSQSESIPNFPVYGNSPIELDNIDKDRNLEFVTKGESNSVLLYQIN
ncbi:PQQ-binding-like beta-propeller repeat protein [Tamlana crocina]|uniref:PQQ-binding-like beta-propeller repeat protein n=1 Tax=Tamlana crocina TaxID=393006 RepID=A0ABX1DJK0_9FLAO|nr:PQQ-binding-like beta-propeller repeat protein [Tamlana crocina]NJX16486.1 PQQ-binding-like beta-propeller repeat protein [Tamlana crocina]